MRKVMCMIPKEKMSKQARREMNRERRTQWDMNPVTRVKESKKLYRRNQRWAVED